MLLGRSYCEGSKVRHGTPANLAALPEHAVEALRASLAGKPLIEAIAAGLATCPSLPHGHVAAVQDMAAGRGLVKLLGPARRERDVGMGLLAARV